MTSNTETPELCKNKQSQVDAVGGCLVCPSEAGEACRYSSPPKAEPTVEGNETPTNHVVSQNSPDLIHNPTDGAPETTYLNRTIGGDYIPCKAGYTAGIPYTSKDLSDARIAKFAEYRDISDERIAELEALNNALQAQTMHLITTQPDLATELATARKDALEEAAKAAEGCYESGTEDDYQFGCDDAACTIRALKSEGEG